MSLWFTAYARQVAATLGPEPEPQEMRIDVNALSSLAADYTKGMTSIRGRRVQRLLKREFAGAQYVFIVQIAPLRRAVLGLTESGAGFCSTDGTGKQASVSKWLHGSSDVVEVQFDLLKDSLPVLATRTIPLSDLMRRAEVNILLSTAPHEANLLASAAFEALA